MVRKMRPLPEYKSEPVKDNKMNNYELSIAGLHDTQTYTFQADAVESVNLGMCIIIYAIEGNQKKEIAQFSHGHQWLCVNTSEVNKS